MRPVGDADGAGLGDKDGAVLGDADGTRVGCPVVGGVVVGVPVVGLAVVGARVGGASVGTAVGASVVGGGVMVVGKADGARVGADDGARVGSRDGADDGGKDGARVGGCVVGGRVVGEPEAAPAPSFDLRARGLGSQRDDVGAWVEAVCTITSFRAHTANPGAGPTRGRWLLGRRRRRRRVRAAGEAHGVERCLQGHQRRTTAKTRVPGAPVSSS